MNPAFVRSLAIVIALPVFARAHVLLGFFLSDPVFRSAGLATRSPGAFPGLPWIDPNYGFVDEALTTRALNLIVSGHFPWWNSLEGFGAPLAGEMQSSALFPFAPFVLLPNGNLILNIVLAIVAGTSMYLLLYRLALAPWAALVGAILYESSGTSAWLPGAWSYAIPWLPVLIIGIENCRAPNARSARKGMFLVGASIALLIYSGFVETAYIEGLVGIGWAGARFFATDSAVRARYSLLLLGGAALGLELSAPLLIAFADTLAMSYLGVHGAGGTPKTLPIATLIQKFLPYVYGPIFASRQGEVSVIWGNTGGYIGFIPALLAIAGVFRTRDREIRILLAAVVALGLSAILGGPLQKLLVFIPAIRYAALFRYVDPAMWFAICILAAFAIDDVLEREKSRKQIMCALIAMIAIVAFAYAAAVNQIASGAATVDADLAVWHGFSFWEMTIASGAVCIALLVRGVRVRGAILGLAVCAEAVVLLIIPTLSYPTGGTVALGGVNFLIRHAGLERFYTLGPLEPNYGSYFGVASLAYNDLPIPTRTVDYIKEQLDPLADAINFLGTLPRPGTSQKDNFAQRIHAFERAAVKYVLTYPSDPAPSPDVRLTYRDSAMAIYELPNPAPYFAAPGCVIDAISRASVTTTCNAASALCRLELNAPGWTADVDGRAVRPYDCGEIFEGVDLPKGTSHITFRFDPPFETFGLLLAGFASIAFLVCAVSLIGRPPERLAF